MIHIHQTSKYMHARTRTSTTLRLKCVSIHLRNNLLVLRGRMPSERAMWKASIMTDPWRFCSEVRKPRVIPTEFPRVSTKPFFKNEVTMSRVKRQVNKDHKAESAGNIVHVTLLSNYNLGTRLISLRNHKQGGKNNNTL